MIRDRCAICFISVHLSLYTSSKLQKKKMTNSQSSQKSIQRNTSTSRKIEVEPGAYEESAPPADRSHPPCTHCHDHGTRKNRSVVNRCHDPALVRNRCLAIDDLVLVIITYSDSHSTGPLGAPTPRDSSVKFFSSNNISLVFTSHNTTFSPSTYA